MRPNKPLESIPSLSTWLALAGFLLTGQALAQQDASFSGFQLNRSLPGARSLAMGGAFVALADDATAAFANPAGLTILERPEVSLEIRSWDVSSTYTDLGRIDGQPTGIGLDSFVGLTRRETESSLDGVSFASFVFARPARRWAVGFFHHTLADYSSSFRSQGVFTDTPPERFGPFRFSTNLTIEDLGATFAYRTGDCVEYRGCLRLGVTLASYSFEVEAIEVVHDDPPQRGVATFNESIIARLSTIGDDDDLAASVGLLWEPSERWRLGLAYRQGPELGIDQRGFAGAGPGRFKVPDRYAIGAAVSPSQQLTISFELDRVEYSSLLEGNRLAALEVDDATEARLGMEYVVFFGSPTKPHRLALMAGAWHDPDHTIVFTREIVTAIDIFRSAYFPDEGSDELHLTVGIGVNLGGFQLDFGADFSDRIDTLGLSSVYRF